MPPMHNSPNGPTAVATGEPAKLGTAMAGGMTGGKPSDTPSRGWKGGKPSDTPLSSDLAAPEEESTAPIARTWRTIFGGGESAHYEIGAWFISAVAHGTALLLLGLWIHHAVKDLVPVDASLSTSNQPDMPLADLPGDAASLDEPKPGTPGSPSAKPGGDPSIVDPLAKESTESPVGPIDLLPALGQPGIPSAPQPNALDGVLFAEHSGVPWGEALRNSAAADWAGDRKLAAQPWQVPAVVRPLAKRQSNAD